MTRNYLFLRDIDDVAALLLAAVVAVCFVVAVVLLLLSDSMKGRKPFGIETHLHCECYWK